MENQNHIDMGINENRVNGAKDAGASAKVETSAVKSLRVRADALAGEYLDTGESAEGASERRACEKAVMGVSPRGTTANALTRRQGDAIQRENTSRAVLGLPALSAPESAAIAASVVSKANLSDARRGTRHSLGVLGLRVLTHGA